MRRALIAIFVIAGMSAFAAETPLTYLTSVRRKIPPSTNAGNSLVRVTVTTENMAALAGAGKLKHFIEELMYSIAEYSAPIVTIDVSLLSVEVHETYMSTTRTERRRTGTRRVWNDLEHRYQEEWIYGDVPVLVTFNRFTARATGTYKIAAHGIDIAAGSIERQVNLDQYEGNRSLAPPDAEGAVMGVIAREISVHLVPSQDDARVLLPFSSHRFVDQPEPYQDWRSYLWWIDDGPAKTVEDEAYRQYEMAIAKEALAYDQYQTRDQSLALLRSAVDHLQQAIRMNPNEVVFHTDSVGPNQTKIGNPLARMYDSLARYEEWIPQPDVYDVIGEWSPCPLPTSVMLTPFSHLNGSTAQQPPHR